MRRLTAGVSSLAALALGTSAQAVILYSTGDNTSHTTSPPGAFPNSGWQYQGNFGPFSGTAIGPHAFITAAHTGPGVGGTFNFAGINYVMSSVTPLAGRDLAVVMVNGTLPFWAPIYDETTDGSLLGKTTVIMGRGTERGVPINVSTDRGGTEGTLRGWVWGVSGGSVRRWGTNVINDFAQIDANDSSHEYIRFSFDQDGLPDEATVSGGDSGGGEFVQGAGDVWKLTGVNSQVETFFKYQLSDPSATPGAIFDFRDLYVEGDDNQFHLGQDLFPTGATVPLPARAYSVNVADVPASDLAAYIPRAGDANVDGFVNSFDFNVLATHFGTASGAVWLDGDFNFDGIVNAFDFNALATNFGTSYTLLGSGITASPVPEPGALTLMLSAAPLLKRSPRRHQL